MKIIDLFSGCGGLSLGFVKNGHTIVKAVEFDREIAESYKKNHPNVNVIVNDISNIDLNNTFKESEADVIVGGPPCQGFSMAGLRIRDGFIDDPRNYLFRHYFNVVKLIKPQVFVLENVKGLISMNNGKIFKEIIRIFSTKRNFNGSSYNIYYKIVNSVDFGVPQKRERVILIGVKNNKIDFNFLWEKAIKQIKQEFPNFFSFVTVRDAIANLPSPTDTGLVVNPIPQTNYQKELASKDNYIKNHCSTNHSLLAISRMKKISSGGNFKDLNEQINSVHSGSYGRLKWDEPSTTITTRFDTPAGGRFTHPVEDRTLTPREAARLQSFPDDFVFYGNRTSVHKQIGNAVPPKVSYFISKLVDIIKGEIS